MAKVFLKFFTLTLLLNISSAFALVTERLTAPNNLEEFQRLNHEQYQRIMRAGRARADYAIRLMGYSRAGLNQLERSTYYEDLIAWTQITTLANNFFAMDPIVFSTFKDLLSKQNKKSGLSFRQIVELFQAAQQIAFEAKKAEVLARGHSVPGQTTEDAVKDRKYVRASTLESWKLRGVESASFSIGRPLLSIAQSNPPTASDFIYILEGASKKRKQPLFNDLFNAASRESPWKIFLNAPSVIVKFYFENIEQSKIGSLSRRHIKRSTLRNCEIAVQQL